MARAFASAKILVIKDTHILSYFYRIVRIEFSHQIFVSTPHSFTGSVYMPAAQEKDLSSTLQLQLPSSTSSPHLLWASPTITMRRNSSQISFGLILRRTLRSNIRGEPKNLNSDRVIRSPYLSLSSNGCNVQMRSAN